MSVRDEFDSAPEVRPATPEPSPGVVLQWRRRGDVWEGLVPREVDGKIITAWEPALMMAPLHRREPTPRRGGGLGRLVAQPAEAEPIGRSRSAGNHSVTAEPHGST